ncbi:hypothetical protein CXF68_20275 [Tenacibaculum sp. Bg11-29]|uniref:hypothetical protein n=1 Tax=Tenacibaculum sp. Bg11-29 TaxID=2058306 RepID=UPI000C322EE3|nr:hypothetical protein [Tenacibaculum sp. Bg11-29]PKH52431.1 hypothetical protein CXF68_17795 [Tenacibaculum sp. Bg11-29]PKH52891.1 hypothetical protein CXF68_20275 [Tenacibaculum sp. Bg11-29]
MNYTPNEKKLGLNNNSNLKVMFNEELSLLPIYQESLISMIQSSLVMEENDSYFKNAHAINCLDILKGLMIGRNEYVQLSKQQKHEDRQRKKNLKRKIKEMEEEIKEQKKIIAESLKTVENNVTEFVTELVA